jgi:hypothetical protein
MPCSPEISPPAAPLSTSTSPAVTGCEQLETIGHPLLRMIETTFGTALADLWRQ